MKKIIIVDSIRALSNLKDGWDGEGAFGITDMVSNNTSKFIKELPEIYCDMIHLDNGIEANSNGTITIELRKENRLLSLEFGNTTFSWFTRRGDCHDSCLPVFAPMPVDLIDALEYVYFSNNPK